jgi:hypothetical protein
MDKITQYRATIQEVLSEYHQLNVKAQSTLLQKGIAREEIVLAFHPPQVRQHTEFAIA